jgi:hypothetical protein
MEPSTNEVFYFMEPLIHRTPSAGSIIKKIHELNPELKVPEIIQIIRQSVEIQSVGKGEFAGIEIINEAKALALAKAAAHSRQ